MLVGRDDHPTQYRHKQPDRTTNSTPCLLSEAPHHQCPQPSQGRAWPMQTAAAAFRARAGGRRRRRCGWWRL